MDGKNSLSFLAAILLTTAPVIAAQQPAKVFRIGYLDVGTASGIAIRLDLFRQELNKLGWVEGKNLVFEYRFAEQRSERLPGLAAELVRKKVDLIVTSGGPTPFAVKNATSTIPVVMTTSTDPVRDGLVASLARPGGNITGFTGLNPQLGTKRLEILKDAIPKLLRVGLLRTPGTGNIAQNSQFKDLPPAAQALKLKLEEIKTEPEAEALENAYQTAKRKQVGAILIMSGNRLFAERKRIAELAVKHRMPAIYPTKLYVEAGGLMSYGSDSAEGFQRAAHHVDKILRGTKPADIPVEQAMKFEFIINLPAAKKIGITLPYELLARANQVIK